MKEKDLFILGALGIGAYLLYRYFNTGAGNGGGGGGGGGGDVIDQYGTQQPPTFYYRAGGTSQGSVIATQNVRDVHASAGSRQQWTGATYGQAGQPSVNFAINTVREASIPGASPSTILAGQGVRAGAPPRVVAKMKAGKWY